MLGPTGQTEFQFKEGDLNFHAESYDWLVVDGSKAIYKGTGTVNGAGDYSFFVAVIDGQISGSTDTFRIKIWDKDSGDVVYNNQLDTDPDIAADPTTPWRKVTSRFTR